MADPTAFGLGQFRFGWGDHVCAIFEDPEQQKEIMGQFVAHGLQSVQRCVWVGPTASARRLRGALAELGADLPTLEASNQLVIVSEVDFYLQDGLFEPERTLDLMHLMLDDGRRQGYASMRMATDLSWLRRGRLDLDTWESYEMRLTEEIRGLPVVLVCQYDRRQASGSLIVTALRTHPVVILGDVVHENPFYAPGAEEAARPPEIL